MPYLEQTRASSDALGFLVDGSMDPSVFVPIPLPVLCGEQTRTFKSNGVVQKLPVYARSHGAYGGLGGVVGTQTTYSWRTGKSVSEQLGDEPLRGDDIIRAIRAGYDIEIKGSVGADQLIDRNVSAHALGRKLNSFDNGHNFRTSKWVDWYNIHTRTQKNWINRTFYREDANSTYVLKWWGYPPSFTGGNPYNQPGFTPPRLNTRLADGSQLVGLAAPNRPYVDAIRAIGELIKDGIPSMVGHSLLKGTKVRDLGSEYLNAQFGIIPTASDARKIFNAVIESRDILAAYNKASGEFTRRKRAFPESRLFDNKPSRSQGINWSARLGSPTAGVSSLAGYLDRNDVQSMWFSDRLENVYFSGAFTYAVPDGDGVLGRFDYYADQAGKLLGRGVTLSTLYDLTPFSWLVDWLVDFGSVFSNAFLFNANNLVMKYGYVMHNMSHNISNVITGLKDQQGNALPALVNYDRTYMYATRDRATPYGFAIDTDALTGYQWSILAALGLSRGRNIRRNEPPGAS